MGFDMPALCLICLTWGVGDKTRQEKARKGKKRQEKARKEKARKGKKRKEKTTHVRQFCERKA